MRVARKSAVPVQHTQRQCMQVCCFGVVADYSALRGGWLLKEQFFCNETIRASMTSLE